VIGIEDLVAEPQVRVTPSGDLMINVQRTGAGAAVHLIRYDFDPEKGYTPPLPDLTVELRLPERFARLSVHSPDGQLTGGLESDAQIHRIRLREVPLYGVALLEPA
jgi:hypothetical protein